VAITSLIKEKVPEIADIEMRLYDENGKVVDI
jgi:hypothetical protein